MNIFYFELHKIHLDTDNFNARYRLVLAYIFNSDYVTALDEVNSAIRLLQVNKRHKKFIEFTLLRAGYPVLLVLFSCSNLVLIARRLYFLMNRYVNSDLDLRLAKATIAETKTQQLSTNAPSLFIDWIHSEILSDVFMFRY